MNKILYNIKTKERCFFKWRKKRTNKIIDLISKYQNLTNTSFYEYTDDQIDAIFSAIQNELNIQKKIFEEVKSKGKKRFEL